MSSYALQCMILIRGFESWILALFLGRKVKNNENMIGIEHEFSNKWDTLGIVQELILINLACSETIKNTFERMVNVK